MRYKLALALGSGILVGLALSASYAEDQQQKPTDQAAPPGHEMMGMPGQMQHMMNNPEMAAQMRQMMENCNKMMESMMQQSPSAPAPEKGG